METTLRTINAVISALFFICYTYQFLYIPLVLAKKPKPLTAPDRPHRYAVLIAARNEENVISGLLDSLRAQTYDMSLVTVFVAADNCTDRTAAIARAHGAVVYERFNQLNVGKGYALDFLLQNIGADYPEGFDGYFVFDADNLLAPDYIERMNEMFSNGQIVTSYRNSKNFGGNWISAGYALWFLRESRYLNGARNRLGSSAAVGGTGFLFSQRVLDESHGWRFYLLTEDIEFSVYHILRGEKIAICEDAVLYDEQPTGFRQSVRQRLRWAKGYLQVFRRYGADLLKGAAKGSWSCFDMSMSILPAFILTALCLLANITLSVLGLMQGVGVWFTMRSLLECMGSILATLLVLGGITVASEWKRIHAPAWKKIAYTLTFPLFMLTYLPISMAALFMKVEWKPIHHSVNLSSLPYPAAKN
mgnify:CR=1 FL=1